MEKDYKLPVRKPKSRVWSFIGGSLFGFFTCLIAIGITLCVAYFKVSPKWINKHFKTQIDLGSETANNKTIRNFVNGAMHLAQNIDTYTINDLKKDFGLEVANSVYGIDISDLKNVPFSEIGNKIEEKVQNLSAYELEQINGVDLQSMNDILNKKNTYQYNSSTKKLTYSDSTEVAFKYTISEDETKVYIKNKEIAISSNQIEVQLWDLPIFIAFQDFVDNMGDQLTLEELEDSFGVQLPEILNNVDKSNTTVNQLEDVINDLTVADFLEYTVDTTTKPGETIVKDKNGNAVTGVEKALATFKIGDLSEGINSLKIQDVFAEDDISNGVLKLIDKETTIENVPDAINEKMKVITLGELVDNKIISLSTTDSAYFAAKRDMYISGTNTKLKDITISDMTSSIFTFLPLSDTPAG